MRAREMFEQEMAALRCEVGLKAAEQAYLVFAKATSWLRHNGHGNLQLSAVDHVFGSKIRGDTIFTVEDIQ